jgi:hypothetical protein
MRSGALLYLTAGARANGGCAGDYGRLPSQAAFGRTNCRFDGRRGRRAVAEASSSTGEIAEIRVDGSNAEHSNLPEVSP